MDGKKSKGRPGRKAATPAEVEAPAAENHVVAETGAKKKAPTAKGKPVKEVATVDVSKAAAASPEKKKSGRKGKAPAVVESDPLELEAAEPEPVATSPTAAKGKKGRKPAAGAKEPEPEPVVEEQAAPAAKKGRGRKPAENGTSSPVVEAAPAPKAKGRSARGKEVVEEEPEVAAAPAKRGRGKAKAEAKEPEEEVAASPAKKSKPTAKEAAASPPKKAGSPKKATEPEAVSEDAAAPKETKGGRGRKKGAAAPVEEKATSPAKSPAAAAPAKRGRKKATAESEDKPPAAEKPEKVKKASAASKKKADKKTTVVAAAGAEEVTPPKKDAVDAPVNGETPKMSSQKRSLFQKILQLTQRKKKKTVEEGEDGAPKAKKTKAAAGPKMNKSVTDYSKLSFGHEGGEFNVKITSWNVAGLRSWVEKGCLEFLEHEAPDILCLQETKCTEDQLPEEARHIKGYHPYWLCKPGGYAGVAIYSKKMPFNVSYGLGDAEQDEDGRLLTAEYEKFYLVCVYVPNAGRKLVTLPKRMRWDEKFHQYLRDLDAKKPVILCGDMNVAHAEIDLANPKTNKKNAGFTQEERDGMTKLLSYGFVDTFRQRYPTQKGAYTFWTYMGNARSKNVGWRLDYFIASERLAGRVVDSVIRSGVYGSDHCPITLLLNL